MATVWRSELSLTEQVRRPGVREIISLQDSDIRDMIGRLGVPSVPLTGAPVGHEVPAILGMRLRTQVVRQEGDVRHIRWSVVFSPAHGYLTRRLFSSESKVRYPFKPRLERLLQELTVLLRPMYEGGVIDVFYFLTPEHLPVMWFVPDAFEDIAYRQRLALRHNRHVHASYYFFLPEAAVNFVALGMIAPLVRLFGVDPARVPHLHTVPIVPPVDLWKKEDTRQQCKALFEKGWRAPMDSLWRAVFAGDPASSKALERMGYRFTAQDHTVFDATGNLKDVMEQHMRNLANLPNLTLFSLTR